MMKSTSHTQAETALALQQLKSKAFYNVALGIKDNVLVTHEQLFELRQCVDQAIARKNYQLYIVAQRQLPQVKFLVKTLIHLGISCGQIECLYSQSEAAGLAIFLLEKD